MEPQNKRRLQVWVPLLFALVMVLGMFLGFRLRDTLRNKKDFITIIQRNDDIQEIIDLVNSKYVDTVNNDKIHEDAIQGILDHLDPHSSYIPASELQAVNEDLEGKFEGIGIEFSIINDTVNVTSVLAGGPSEGVGLLTGDKIVKVNDTAVAGIKITNETIIGKLRGHKGEKVKVSVKRSGKPAPVDFVIARDVIPIYSVDASYMIRPEVGYIKVNRFSATTHREFMQSIDKLNENGMKKLVLDLRQNPGGFMDAATKMLDEFIEGNKLLVYTQGRRFPKTEYKTKRPGVFETGDMVVLIDEGSASASEIVAGAIQDWDRGTIIGRRSYGKGLVQEQYDLPDGAALRLTVARYYTPSGRSIQRPYDKGKDEYQGDIYKRYHDGELISADSTAKPNDTTKYYTAAHRVVYGGGGITPDIFVPLDTARYSTTLVKFLSEGLLNTFVYQYFSGNRAQFEAFKQLDDFKKGYVVQQTLLDALKQFSAKENSALAFPATASDVREMQLRIKGLFARQLFRSTGYYAVMNEADPVIVKALQVLKVDAPIAAKK
jgi:carboxyl-terminal processing protease